jgi:serine protease Do
MNTSTIHITPQRVRTGLAVLALTVLSAGGAWRSVQAKETAAPTVAAATPAATTTVTPSWAIPATGSYADVVNAVAPAVVTIRVEGRARVSSVAAPDEDLLRRFFGDQFGEAPRQQRSPRQRGLGSGVIVSADGYILTNHHVVDAADSIHVDLTDGRTFKATLVGADAPSDLAVLKVEAKNLHPIAIGDSDVVQVGDVVLAVGNPLGIGQTVTMGIVSAKGRSTGVGDGSYENFLQTDAPINQGNSGGALVNLKGELVGINSQILSTSGGNIGIGFAIPANMAEHVMTLLRTEGRVRRAQLGVTAQTVTSDLAESLGLPEVRGVIVSGVTAGSAADRAGLKQGDVILSLNGQPVQNSNALRNRVSEAAPGSKATVRITRDGKERDLAVTLGELASARARDDEGGGDQERQAALGVAVAPLTKELAREMRLPADARGLVVQEVSPDSRAAAAGIQPGDVIEQVNRQAVDSVDALREAVRRTSDRPLLVLVNREGNHIFLTAPLS